jgi:hypothetical protein
MDFHGAWDPPDGLNVEQWIQKSAEGHDHYVRLVYKGYLYPFGHRVSLVKVTERKFTFRDDHYVAYEKQRMYIVNRQKGKAYPAIGQPFRGRQLPFVTIKLTTTQTPDLDDPLQSPIDATLPDYNFWPTVGGSVYQFDWEQVGSANQTSTVKLPAIFLDNRVAHQTLTQKIRQDYQQHLDRRQNDLNGQIVGYAEQAKPADTDFQTGMFTYTAAFPDTTALGEFQNVDQPPFYPAMESASVRLSAIERLTGGAGITRTIEYYDKYLSDGFGPKNTGEVFAAILAGQAPVYVQFSGTNSAGDRSGGSAAPNSRAIGLSRSLGPICGQPATSASFQLRGNPRTAQVSGGPSLDSMAGGKFDATDYFAAAFADATILGVVKLWNILRPIVQTAASNLGEAPKLIEHVLYDFEHLTEDVLPTVRTVITGVDTQAAAFGVLQQRIHPYCSKILGLLDRIPQQQNLGDKTSSWTELVQTMAALGAEINSIAQNPSAIAQQAAADVASKFLAGLQTPLKPFLDQIAALQQCVDQLLSAKKAAQDALDAVNQWPAQIANVKAAAAAQIGKEVKRLEAMYDVLVQRAATLVKEITHAPGEAWGKAWSSIVAAEAGVIAAMGSFRAELKQLAQLDGFFRNPTAAAQLAATLSSNLGDAYNGLRAQLQNVALDYRVRLQAEFAAVTGVSEQAKALARTLDDDLTALGSLRRDQAWPDDLRQDARVALLRTQAGFIRHMDAFAASLGLDPHAAVNAAGGGPEALWAVIRGWRTELTLADPHITGTQSWQVRLTGLVVLLNGLAVVPRALTGEVTAMAKSVDASFKAGMYGEVLDTLATLSERGGVITSVLSGISHGQTTPGDSIHALAAFVTASEAKALEYQAAAKSAVDGLRAQLPALIGTLQTTQAAVKTDIQSQLTDLQAQLNLASQQLQQMAAEAAADVIVVLLPPLLELVAQIAQRLLTLLAGALPCVAEALEIKRQVDELLSKIALPAQINATYTFQPVVQSFPGGSRSLFEVLESPSDTLSITTNVVAHLPVKGPVKPPEINIDGQLKNFGINLAGADFWFLTISFNHFNLKSANGEPPKFDVEIRDVVFGDRLSFIQQLAKALDPDEGPFLEFQGTKILAGFRFQLPTIQLGGFAMRDLRFLVEASISLKGDPMRMRIAISERQHPFLIQIGILGGGGFFAMELGLDGVQMLEGALEYGVTASISIGGVASGFGYVLAGIYFAVEKVPAGNGTTRDKTTLCGFVRAGGHLSIIGLISMNLDILCRPLLREQRRSQSGAWIGRSGY